MNDITAVGFDNKPITDLDVLKVALETIDLYRKSMRVKKSKRVSLVGEFVVRFPEGIYTRTLAGKKFTLVHRADEVEVPFFNTTLYRDE
jgi:hypothetical protein